MKKRDVNQMSMREIINKFEIGVGGNNIFGIIGNIDEFFARGYELFQDVKVSDFLLQNEDIIDKEKLLFYDFLTLQQKVEYYEKHRNNSQFDQAMYEEKLKKLNECYDLLKDSKVELPDLFIREDGKMMVEKLQSFHEIVKGKTPKEMELKQKNLQILNEMKEQKIAEIMLLLINESDLSQYVCQYRGNGEIFKYIIRQRIEQDLSEEEMVVKSTEDKIKKAHEEIISTMTELIEKFPEKFKMDHVLLLAAYRAKQMLEKEKGIKEDQNSHKECVKIMQFAKEHIENPNTKILGPVYENHLQKSVDVDYKFKNLQGDVSRIVDGSYFSKEDLIQIRQKLFSGEVELGASNRELIELLHLTKEEKSELVKVNPNNFESFVMAGMLDKAEVKNMLENMEEGIELSNRVIDCLCCDDLLENRDFVDMYMRKQINLKQVCRLDDFYHLQSEITVDELMQYYENREQVEEQEIDFEKYALLFREIRQKNSEEEEKQQIAEQIMEKLYETERDYEADLKNLYGANLLPIRTLIDWNGEKMIYDLIEDASIKPKDAKELLMTGELDVTRAYQALKDSDLSDAEKLNFIFSSFDGVGSTPEEIKAQNEARMYLIQAMNISKDFVDYSETKTYRVARQKGETKQKWNRYVSDPVYRWQLFSQIDKDCDSKPFADGSVVFTLPNVGNGTVVVEKLFKSTQKGTQINYGSATYCMNEEEYLNRKDEVEREGKINRKALVQMHKDEKASRAVHSKAWGKDLKKILGISAENGYSEEKIAEIDGLMEQIENSKELVR